jgi:hypothetical protein
MSRRSVPKIAPNDLRDHADEARIARVWDRIENDLGGVREAPPHRTGVVMALIAATMCAFGGGLFAGKFVWGERPSAELTAVAPSDHSQFVDVIAAGSQERTVPLPGGGRITLAPDTTVEVERTSGGALTLRLVRGEAAVDTATAAAAQVLAIIAGEARLSAGTGSVVRVRRNQDDMDVTVSDGSVRVTSPAGSQEIEPGHAPLTVPIRTSVTTTHNDDANRPRHAAPLRPDVIDPVTDAPSVVAAAPPDWLARANANDRVGAIQLLQQQPGGIAGAIASAKTAGELMAISDLARSAREPDLARSALTRVVESFPNDQRAHIAAFTLGGLYERAGQTKLAQMYFQKAQSLQPESVLAQDALCKQIQAEHRASNKDEAVRLAKDYQSKYPNGRCKEEVERIISGDDAPADDSAPATPAAPESAPEGGSGSTEPAPAPSSQPAAPPPSSPPSQPKQP